MLNEVEKLVDERHELTGEEIGRTISLEEIVSATLRAFVDIKREEVEARLDRFETKRMVDLGKMKLLEEVENQL